MALHPSFVTTPVGMAIGLALTRIIKSQPKWYHYLAGGGLGGGAGYAAGEALHRLPKPGEKEVEAPVKAEPTRPELERGAVRQGMKPEEIMEGDFPGKSLPIAKNFKEKLKQLQQTGAASVQSKERIKKLWLKDVAAKFREANRRAVRQYPQSAQRGLIEYRRQGGAKPMEFLSSQLKKERPSAMQAIDKWMAGKLKGHPYWDFMLRGSGYYKHIPRAFAEKALSADSALFESAAKPFLPSEESR